MALFAVIGLIVVIAGVALCFYGHLIGLILILVGAFLVDLFKDQAMAAAVSKHRNSNRSSSKRD